MNTRHFCLKIIVAAIFLAPHAVFAQETPPETDIIWQLGIPDARCAEFGKWFKWEDLVPRKENAHRFVIGKNTPADWPPQHISTRDLKNAGHQFTYHLEFNLSRTYENPVYFVVGSCFGHLTEPSLMKIRINGTDLPPERLPSDFGTWEFQANHDTKAFFHTQFTIPAEALKPGKNELSITLEDGSWIFYDYLVLRENPGPLAIRPVEGMLREFRQPGGPMADVKEVLFAVKKPGKDPHWYANFGYYAADKDAFPFPLGEGGELRILNLDTGETRTLFRDPGGNIRDPQIHYDGKKAIFSYLPAGRRHYNLYEINLDGTGLRQITDGDWDDVEATYLPNGDIIFASTRAQCWVQCWLTSVATLHRCGPNGENIRRITSNPEQENTPWVLPNGQVIYMRWEYVDRSQVHYHHLWVTNPDGTKQNIYFGNLHPGIVMLGAKPVRYATPEAEAAERFKVVCTFSPGHGIREHYGRVALVDPRSGPDDLASVKYISPRNDHADPWAFSGEAFMAVKRQHLVFLDGDGREMVGYTLPQDEVDAGFWISDAQPLITRQRETIVADQTDDAKEYGQIAMVDIYEGRKLGALPRGSVKELLVLEPLQAPIHYNGGMQQISSGGTFILERIVGTVPVAEDGSAFMELPGRRSYLFIAMDHDGNPVKRMHSFTSVMPGEVNSCIGCHEQRTVAPPMDNDYKLFQVMSRKPVRPQPVEGVPEVMDFVRDIQPILDRHCVECHNADRADAGVDLSGDMRVRFSASYQTLNHRQMFGDNRNRPQSDFEPYEIGSSASKLVKLVESGHPDKDGKPMVAVSPHEKKMIRCWIEVGANYAGTYAANATGVLIWSYYESPVFSDTDWPEVHAMQETIARRCGECHADGKLAEPLPNLLSAGGKRYGAANVFNFTHPEKSRMLRGPLAADAGGYGRCYRLDDAGKRVPANVFPATDDADYQKILAAVARGKHHLTVENPRWWMPNYAPNAAYVREMKRYGVLPEDYVLGTPLDPWATDEKYWRAQWPKAK